MQFQILDYLKFSRLKFIISKTEAKQPVGVVAIEIDKAQRRRIPTRKDGKQ